MARTPKLPRGRRTGESNAVADLLRKGTPEDVRLKQPEGSHRRQMMDDLVGAQGTPSTGRGTGPPLPPRPKSDVTRAPGGLATPPGLKAPPAPTLPKPKAPTIQAPKRPKPPGIPRTPGINRLPRAY